MEKKLSARDRILQVAADLFYREGIRAVGIDRIIAESGVAKASFYRSFATKDDLVVAFLEVYHQRSIDRIEAARRNHPGQPGEQLRELFRGFAERIASPDYRGCPFMNTIVEFPDAEFPGHKRATESRREAWALITEMARESGATDAAALASQLEILYSGAVMTSYMYRTRAIGDQFYKAALLLLKEHIPGFIERG
ncbi:TetR/AcrR family transcriptional regulator [Paenibacillus chartarius]|uniref:TetR/AcrR family transcriptional regulator n=1 Tax=Paenibacillus chartarius TaxID=747481 RepID=A0ABV6DIV4_9BACL